jgi:hypothetical protein
MVLVHARALLTSTPEGKTAYVDADLRDVGAILDAPSGSVLALSTVTADSVPEEVTRGVAAYNARGISEKARDRAEVARLFGGLDLIDPGVTLVTHWRPDEAARAVDDTHVHMYGGIAVKP